MGQMSGGGSGDFADPNNMNGNVATMSPGAGSGPSPWMKLLAGGAKGGLQGFSNMQGQRMQPQGGPPAAIPMPMQPQVNLPGGPNDPNNPRVKSMFYGQ